MDYLRGFAVLAVIGVHTTMRIGAVAHVGTLVLLNAFVHTVSLVAVPLFVFISGFVLPVQYYAGFSLRSFYLKRAKTVIPAYLVFSTVYIGLRAMTNGLPGAKTVGLSLLLGSSAFHMWFFPLIIQLYALYPAIIKAYRFFEVRNKLTFLLVLTLFIQIGWSIFRFIFNMTVDAPLAAMVMRRAFVGYIFFFVLGIYAGRNVEWLKNRLHSAGLSNIRLSLITIFLTAVISLAWIVDLASYDSLGGIPSLYFEFAERMLEPIVFACMFVLLLEASTYLMNARNAITSVLHTLGTHAFGIYLVHVLLMEILISALVRAGTGTEDWAFYPILFIATAVSSYLATHLISRLPYGETLVGVRAKRASGQHPDGSKFAFEFLKKSERL